MMFTLTPLQWPPVPKPKKSQPKGRKRLGVNVSMTAEDQKRFLAAAAKAPGHPTLSLFVRQALEEKIRRDGLA